ncbi:MAG: DUF5682 family protein [Acutalibacteraceae bacterium]
MERILRNKEIFKIIPFDYSDNILFFPIRHHSPACSYHLMNAIKEYKPDCILVEGPQNANRLIPVLTDDKTELPVAFYYFYKDTAKLVSEEGKDYKCYYPFLDASPEYNALNYAVKTKTECSFIDLPYGEILINTAENSGMREEKEIQSYNDDSCLSENDFFKALCEKTGMRNFEEFWENFFETDALSLSTEDFVARMMSYCYLSRQDTPYENMQNDGCIVREQYMAKNIKTYSEKYNRILVVTGGFHTYGLYTLINSSEAIPEVTVHNFDEKTQNVFSMAYSLEAADALNGYASGMQNPGFYDKVWKSIKNQQNISSDVYNDVVLETLLLAAKQANKQNLLITMSDISSAVTMYEGLALMRNKKAAGLYELYDSVQSCFVKGELNLSSELPLKILSKIATGDKIGKLCPNSEKSPLIIDFEDNCHKYGLKADTVLEQKIELDIFSKPKHMNISRFFYRVNFLETNFAKRVKGADMVSGTDRTRIKELWKYSRSVNTDSALIDANIYGATIEEACKMLSAIRISSETSCCNAAKLYVECFLMNIDISEKFYDRMKNIIINDGDFFSIGKGIYYFNMLLSLKKLYNSDDEVINFFLSKCFQKILIMLPSMMNINPDRSQECIKICKMLYTLVSGGVLNDEYETLFETFRTMSKIPNPEPSLYGAVLGLLYGNDVAYKTEIRNALNGYLSGSTEMHRQGASFIRGLFYTARDIVLVGNEFVKMINRLIQSLSIDDFMEILPEFRLAFSYFTPSEINDTAEKVAALYDKTGTDITKSSEFYTELYAAGSKLEEEICAEIEKMQSGKLQEDN